MEPDDDQRLGRDRGSRLSHRRGVDIDQRRAREERLVYVRDILPRTRFSRADGQPDHQQVTQDPCGGRRRRALAITTFYPMNPKLSLFLPVYNEEENLQRLNEKIFQALEGLGHSFEVIYVDDGSADRSLELLKGFAAKDRRVRVIAFRRNYGQTAAMAAGISVARGDVLIPMDADLQNDPADIERLLAKLDEGYDVVSGWRKDRQDALLTRTLPSKLANELISKISGVKLHDYGCSLKAYRREVLKDVQLYGEMHRFIPIYASWAGASVTE